MAPMVCGRRSPPLPFFVAWMCAEIGVGAGRISGEADSSWWGLPGGIWDPSDLDIKWQPAAALSGTVAALTPKEVFYEAFVFYIRAGR